MRLILCHVFNFIAILYMNMKYFSDLFFLHSVLQASERTMALNLILSNIIQANFSERDYYIQNYVSYKDI